MTTSRWLSLAGSVALHAVALALVVGLFSGERTEQALFIDLTVPAPALPPTAAVPDRPHPSAPAGGRPPRSRATSAPPRPAPPSSAAQSEPRPDPGPPDVPVPREREEPARVADAPKPVDVPPAPAPAPSATVAPPAVATPATTDSADGASASAPAAFGGRASDSGGTGGASGGPGKGSGGHAAGGVSSSGRGSGGEGAAIARSTPGAGESVDLSPYHEVLRRHIRESLEYPAAVRRRGLRGTVEVDIVVRADGAIRDVTLARSSSHPPLDDAAVAALKRLPPVSFPPGLPPRALRVRVPVVFDLR